MLDKLKSTQVNPAYVFVGLAVVAVVMAYFVLLKPQQDYAAAKALSQSPEAIAKRNPDNRKVDPGYAKLLQDLRQKEGVGGKGDRLHSGN